MKAIINFYAVSDRQKGLPAEEIPRDPEGRKVSTLKLQNVLNFYSFKLSKLLNFLSL